MWFVALTSLAHAEGFQLPVPFNPCWLGNCIVGLRAIDGVIVPWDDLVLTEHGPVEPDTLRIFSIDRGLVELWVDGRELRLDAAVEERGTSVWEVPVTSAGQDVYFEVISLVEGLSAYQVTVQGL